MKIFIRHNLYITKITSNRPGGLIISENLLTEQVDVAAGVYTSMRQWLILPDVQVIGSLMLLSTLKHSTATLFDLQLDAQNSYLFTYNTFIKILYMFRALPCSSSGRLRRNCIYAASGIVTLCRWLSCAPVKKEISFLTGAQDSHLQRVTIPEAACIYTITT